MPYMGGASAGTMFQGARRPNMPGGPVNVDPMTQQYNLYNSGVEQNAEDYSSIMQGYRNLQNQAMAPNSHHTNAMTNISTLAGTGGYSEDDKRDIRARGMSPIRAIYANANRDIDRQKGIQGGYSPNYGAQKAKMARELSFSLGDQMNNINAGLAERIAGNRVNLAGTYVNASQQGNQAANQALQGQASLYGTTPALANTFGNQALQGAQLQNQITSGQNQQGLQAISQGMQQVQRRR